jgi:hypothetical protein
MEKNMRNVHLEAAIWSLFTSTEFFEAAAGECEDTMKWFGTLAVARNVADFGRNNQIFDKFKQLARDFRRGAELARLGDYQLVWKTAGSVRGDVRGMMEQPLHSWMTKTEYQEFEDIRISCLMKYAGRIHSALNNAMTGADSFYDPDPDCPERSNDDDGYPGDKIIGWYEDYLGCSKNLQICTFPDPLTEYVVDKSIACCTGDEVPWTGIWYPSTGLERHSLTFAIKGLRMQPVYRVVKTTEELRTDANMFPYPETVAVETTWHPLIPSGRQAVANEELRAKAGQPCPKAGIWQPMEPGAPTRAYEAGETMANVGSAYGITVWQWVADR